MFLPGLFSGAGKKVVSPSVGMRIQRLSFVWSAASVEWDLLFMAC